MKIVEKLTYILPDSYVSDMDRFLRTSKGEVDWLGQHVLSAEGCDDKMSFYDLISKNVKPYIDRVVHVDSIHDRLAALQVVDLIRGLMRQSTEAKEACYVVRYIPSSLDRENALLAELDVKVREFSKREFESLFPAQSPEKITSIVVHGNVIPSYVASRSLLVAHTIV